jgi:NAD(P)-dependent dehydrogenase (short-subunit alcohol dehydrogenase family)
MELTGKSALITGAGKRLGREIALALARRGVRVAVHYRRSAEEAAQTARDCTAAMRSAGGEESGTETALAVRAELTDAADTAALFERLRADWGGVHLLVNSVGLHRKTPVSQEPAALEAAFDEQLEVNLRTAARCLRLAHPQMASLGGGAVVNLSDALLRRPFPGFGPYHAAKVALEALTRTWAVEMAPAVRVNAVAPGIVLPAEGDSEASRERWRKRIPLGRLGTPAELADAVCFLLQADYITGQILAVDGGLSWAR